GATGLVGTAGDLVKWARALRGGKVVSEASRDELERGKVLVRREGSSDVYYSFGARIYMDGDRRREVWHSGYDVRVGQSSTVRLLDNGLWIVVLANSGLDANGEPWAAAVARVVDGCLAESTSRCAVSRDSSP
ncbi:MAG TPA: serine hydrolase, partial [Gemmatimonadaceae bacterium]|nr:serine hydrolase [Gemmatimonadaceae bacterium]